MAKAHKQQEHALVPAAVDVAPDEVYRNLYASLATSGKGIYKDDVLNALKRKGIQKDDKRIAETVHALSLMSDAKEISLHEFKEIIRANVGLIERALTGGLVIPDFEEFSNQIYDIFKKIEPMTSGKVATYIPQLARVNPEHFAVSVCTIDGQMFSSEEANIPYCMQSTCKPINYCIALELHGEDKVHSHVGREPSGHGFNEITLNGKGLPHNPMINAGAIMSCSLIRAELPLADRFDHVMNVYSRLTGDHRVNFNNSVYLSEKGTADRNFALAYFMRENGAFPEGTDINATLDFYFQCCSIEVTANQHAAIAATLANAGICPLSERKVFSADTVKNCLSLMYSCGMYDFSGEYAFTVGLPAKSGVSGALMIVVPNVCGIAVWSPRLDEIGNTVRGVEFSKELVKRFNFHNYDSLVNNQQCKVDPRKQKNHAKTDMTFSLIWAASQGDLHEVKRLVAHGVDLNKGDYDGRTALHLAASEGHADTVRYLLARKVEVNPIDRWGSTPVSDAIRHNHSEIVTILESFNNQSSTALLENSADLSYEPQHS